MSMAWRNIWRNKRRTAITVFGMAFGILLSVVITGMSSGAYGEMIDYAAHLGSGHLSIEHEGYRDSPQPAHHVQTPPELLDDLRATPGVRHVVSRVSAAGLLSTAHGNAGAAILGIDPTRESTSTMPILEAEASGATVNTLESGGVWLGAGLLENLESRRGNKVVLTFTDPNGEVVTRLARVTGVLETGAPSVDGGIAIIPLQDLRESLGYGDTDSTYEVVLLEDHRESAAVAARISARLEPPARALPWFMSQPELASFIAVDGSTGIIIQFIVLLLLSAGVFNTIFVSVIERRREFGILRAIGFSRAQIFRLVLAESAWLAALGGAVGALITVGPYLHLHEHGIDFSAMIQPGTEVSGVAMQPVLKVRLYPIQALRLMVVVVVATLVAGLVPAWSACKRTPAAVLRA